MSTHTPGPWEWDGKFTVCIPHAKGLACFRTNVEDARLIAAAPELLDALKLARLWLANCVPVVPIDGPKPLPVIEAAIAKAEGR